MSRSLNMSRRLSSSRKFSKIPISKNVLTNILYLITLALAINYVMKKQIAALLSLFLIAGLVYYFKKNVTLALIVSIIATNLLIAMKYLGGPKLEQLINKTREGMPEPKTTKEPAKTNAEANAQAKAPEEVMKAMKAKAD
uniref:Uncharacterized protein n=1 Tax=viral metagenome TaxID=1070528 RepID=A0A6C0D4L3_9ZZZZ